MDVKISTPLLSALRAAQAGGPSAAPAAGKAQGADFAKALGQALRGVSQSQLETERLQHEYQLGNDSVSLEQTVLSMQKSQIAFQAALTVRNRLVSAYTDIMNMPV